MVAEADAEQRNCMRCFADQLEADAGFVRRARTGRQHDRLGVCRDDRVSRDLVIAIDDDVRPQPAQVMEQVEGEAVLVVDQDDHRDAFRVLPMV